ncbi:ABC1 kinase family protein [Geopsychrobacter electrodiphilus]|uniref:ABC1 kinase family protein n=1 Tax=Geopsychrobacter electrodiphilus TaxID=225196 RepID=UPI0003801413|nr:AarF/UbiB family protein [Geopsychrobacter electrodiphilus]
MLTFSRINRNLRSLKRYRQILGVLIKYGFGHIVEQLNIDYYLELGKRIVSLGTLSHELERLSQAERLRLALEELGPTFIKLGQLLSTRPDVIPPEYINELKKLQDCVPAVSTEEIKKQFERELGAKADALFQNFDPIPLATASVAQVHRGILKNGEQVVFKIRRPGIQRVIETDVDILMGLAYLVENHLPGGDMYDPIGLVKEFRRTINRELDFSREGRTIERFSKNFADDDAVRIPQVHWEYSGRTVLTLEYLAGIKVSHLDELIQAGYDLKIIAHRGAASFLKQVFEHGFFHADPHPGNIYVLPDNVLCIFDFGMVGRLDEDLKLQLTELLLSILERDVDHIISQLLYSGDLHDDSNLKNLKRDLSEFIDDYYDLLLQDIQVGKLLIDFIQILADYQIKFPSNMMLLARALIVIEGLGRQLDPTFNMIDQVRPFAERIVRERYTPANVSKDLLRTLQSYHSLGKSLPKDIKEFINRINHNKFKIDLEHRGLERLITDLDKSSNRISFSLVIAALVIGSSIIMQTDKGPILFGFPALGLLGYSIAGFLGFALAIAILRSGRM